MEANEYQIGGDHYKARLEYQPWDWICDTNQHFLIGNATKYISRWRDKDGRKDLLKAKHYLYKATELQIAAPGASPLTHKFRSQLCGEDSTIILLIMDNDFRAAVCAIEQLIKHNQIEDLAP